MITEIRERKRKSFHFNQIDKNGKVKKKRKKTTSEKKGKTNSI